MPQSPEEIALDRIRQASDSGAESLDLSRLGLTTLPSEVGQLIHLTELDLSENQLASLPSEIGYLTNLTQLELSFNHLTNLPPEISSLLKLTHLNLWQNQFSDVPKELWALSSLQNLSLSDNPLLSLPKELWEINGLEELDLVGLSITKLPKEIEKLENLKRLNLARNELIMLPLEIGNLSKLFDINLASNYLTVLPSSLWKISSLRKISISNNPFPEIPQEIWKSHHWEKLGLGSLGIESIPQELFQLLSLTSLDIGFNNIVSLSGEICKLTNLSRLGLANARLTTLPSNINELKRLTDLNLFHNEISVLPSSFWHLTNLTLLRLGENRLDTLPSEIKNLRNLKLLVLSNNLLKSLPREIGLLTNLIRLWITNNQICVLPQEILNLKNLEYFYIENTPLNISIPIKLLTSSNGQEILDFYKRMYEEGGRELGEARVLVVGEGGVGKTSLVRRLIDDTFDDQEDTTLIVEKRPLPLGDLRAQVWDFGGQEHMHATHQFFFSGRSLYLLVFDTRASLEQNKVEYWLTLINAYSKDSPVILVGNKCDQHEMDVEKRRLREKYPNIRGFVGTSAETGQHIEELRQTIQEEVRAMPQVRVLFSADYLAVKDEMEDLDKPHISHEQFVAICERHGVSDEKDQDTLLDLLHDLGTILYFRDAEGNPLLPALGVLNPNWVTGGVYRIVTNAKLKDTHKGRLSKDLLREILSTPEYARHIEDIAKLLERFELCYRADDSSSYWLPSLMEKDEPAALGDFTSAMKFEYVYPELPRSVIVRFIVKTHKMILDNKVWRYGAVLKLDGNTALVRADEREKRVSIFLAGEESTRREALAILRANFDDIHAMFAAPPDSFIYPPQYPDLRLPFTDMKTLAKTEREYKAVYQGKPVTINLRDLLEGYVTPDERKKDEEREQKEFGRRGDTYITNNNVTVHGNVQGSSLTAGEDNTSSVSTQNSFNTELSDTLEQLTQAVNAMLPHLPAEEAESAKDDLQRLNEEAAKPKPNKKWYSVSIEGLTQAAKNLDELGTPVISLAGKMLKLLNPLS